MYQRGQYRHEKRGRQLLKFDDMEFDSNITPMDIDMLIEYHDKKRVLLEAKLKNTPVPIGERIALERMINDFASAGKESMAIVADHSTFSDDDVYLRDCIVREIYHSREKLWRPPKRMMTVQSLLNYFFYS